MSRRCERPGCREMAAVAYGFDSERSVVWLEGVDPNQIDEVRSGMVCRRHADSMSPPRGWTLDDRRSGATLFGPAEHSPTSAVGEPEPRRSSPRPKRLPRPVDLTSELPFPSLDDRAPDPAATATVTVAGAEPNLHVEHSPPSPAGASASIDPDETKAIPWSPHFDQSDDLGGLLRAESPLLARAFGRRPLREKRADGQPGPTASPPR